MSFYFEKHLLSDVIDSMISVQRTTPITELKGDVIMVEHNTLTFIVETEDEFVTLSFPRKLVISSSVPKTARTLVDYMGKRIPLDTIIDIIVEDEDFDYSMRLIRLEMLKLLRDVKVKRAKLEEYIDDEFDLYDTIEDDVEDYLEDEPVELVEKEVEPTFTTSGNWGLLLVDIQTGQLIEAEVCALETMPLETVINNYLEKGFDTLCKKLLVS
ncbi:hypothetical protein F373_gp072 [Bacillus phage SP-10]|uniref:hypothetical protein n=1 Tax=Bacillus phage SP10 TaxID=941058 RepID=UPI0002198B1C|nr:hypothetical protein F373_gp072 [Bacillus phage SP-10]BAK52884.1 hypothetical protein [Bacillus phage SP-10]